MKRVLRSPFRAVPAVVLAGLMLAACEPSGEHVFHAPSNLEKIAHDTTFAGYEGLSAEPYLEGVTPVPVEGYPDVPPFAVAARTPSIERYPCATCHDRPLAALRAETAGGRRAHWELTLAHAPADVMQCQTCHTPTDMDRLHLLGGKPVAFDHSYQVCAQCHATQAEAWAGGAHGKRLGGWAPPRVVNNCTGCHNPHDPAFKPRWPARATRLARE